PLGFTDAIQCFRQYITSLCRQTPDATLSFLSIGAGVCAVEVKIAELLKSESVENFTFECADINPSLLEKGRQSAEQKSLSNHFRFAPFDVNSWQPERQYHAILAIQSLHHFVELEILF